MTLIAIICAFLRKAAARGKGTQEEGRSRRWSAFRESLVAECDANGPSAKTRAANHWRRRERLGGPRNLHFIIPRFSSRQFGRQPRNKKRDEKSFNKVHSFRHAAPRRLPPVPPPWSVSSPADSHYNASRLHLEEIFESVGHGRRIVGQEEASFGA